MWRGELRNYLKTTSGTGEVDLHQSIAAMLKQYVGDKKSGLLFRSRSGDPLHQSNVLRRTLHPILAELNQPRTGVHAFRRFRITHLQMNNAPEDLIKYWVGHAGESITDSYCKLREDVAFRKEVTERVGIGFKLSEEKVAVVPNVPKSTSKPAKEMAVSA